MPYFLMFLQVALNRLRMNDFKGGILQLHHPQNLVVTELLIAVFMVLTVGAAHQHPYLSTYRLISIKL